MRTLAVLAVLLALPAVTLAQLEPGRHYVQPVIGGLLPLEDLLRNTQEYRTFRPADPTNPVVTDIKLDPGLFVGVRYVYGLTRRLGLEAEVDYAISVHAIRQLEIKPNTDADAEPQYDTTTSDARILQYGLSLSYFLPMWPRLNPSFNVGVGSHSMDLARKGEVDPDPVRDAMVILGLGIFLPANDRLAIRVEVRDYMYNFRYDNQFLDPNYADAVTRPDFLKTTTAAGTKFQNDMVLTVGFLTKLF